MISVVITIPIAGRYTRMYDAGSGMEQSNHKPNTALKKVYPCISTSNESKQTHTIKRTPNLNGKLLHELMHSLSALVSCRFHVLPTRSCSNNLSNFTDAASCCHRVSGSRMQSTTFHKPSLASSVLCCTPTTQSTIYSTTRHQPKSCN